MIVTAAVERLEDRTLLTAVATTGDIAGNAVTGGPQLTTFFGQSFSDTSSASDGTVTAWASRSGDSPVPGWEIVARRSDENGDPLGAETVVNSHAPGVQVEPAVAVADNGSYFVVWQSQGQDGSSWGIYGQMYHAGGVKRGGEFRLNTGSSGIQHTPAVAALSDGTFVVAWAGRGAGDGFGIFARRVSPGGALLGGEFRVNADVRFAQRLPSVAAHDDGGFSVVWSGWSPQDRFGVYLQKYDGGGVRSGGPVLVNSSPDRYQHNPDVAVKRTSGTTVVVWQSHNQDGSGWGIYGQILRGSGPKFGPEFRINQTAVGNQINPAVTWLGNGGFAVTWEGNGAGDDRGIFVREYDGGGAPLGGERLVNRETAGLQFRPGIHATPDGYEGVWSGVGRGDGYGVFRRRYGATPPTATALTVTPPPGSTNVDPSAPIRLTFSRPVDPTTVDDMSFRVQLGGDRIGGTIAVAANRRSATFTPDVPLPAGSDITVMVNGQLLLDDRANGLDADGDGELGGIFTSSFRTEEPVIPPPVSVTPADGERMVNVARPVRVEFREPVDPATVTADSLQVFSRGRNLTGRVHVSSTGRFALFYPDAPLPASSAVRVTVDGGLVRTRGGELLDADDDGRAGGVLAATFRTLPLNFLPNTAVTGRVLRSNATDADGNPVVDPIEGVTIRLAGRPDVAAVTGADGRFTLTSPDGLPAPEFFAVIDGSTATGVPDGSMYPTLGKPFKSRPGTTTPMEMNGEPFDIHLPLMSTGDVTDLDPDAETLVRFGAGGLEDLRRLFPEIDESVWQRTRVTFAPGSARDDAGSPSTQAAIVPVDPARLPGPLPPFLDPRLVISIQAGSLAGGFNDAGGATVFDVPAEVAFPNLEGLAPGQKSLIFSFDHDAGRWTVQGTGTVSADGLMIVSDGGVITAPGWHTVQQGSTLGGGPGQSPDGLFEDEQSEFRDYWAFALDAAVVAAEFIPISKAARGVVRSFDDLNDFFAEVDRITQSGGTITEQTLSILGAGLDTAGAVAINFVPGSGLVGILSKYGVKAEGVLRKADSVLEAIDSGSQLSAQLRSSEFRSIVRGGRTAVSQFRQINNLLNPYQSRGRLAATISRFADDFPLSNLSPGSTLTTQQRGELSRFHADLDEFYAPAPALRDLDFEASIAEAIRQTKNSRVLRDELARETFPKLPARDGRSLLYSVSTPEGHALFRGASDTRRGLPTLTGTPDTEVIVEYYDPFTQSIGRVGEFFGRSGSGTLQAPLFLTPEDGPDADGDGLGDAAEFIVGTSADTADSDGDGVSDGAELAQGTDPLDGFVATTGVVASLELSGPGTAVDVAGDFAYAVHGDRLSVIDATQFDLPVVAGEVTLPEAGRDVAVDAQRRIAAVTTGFGLQLVDVSDPVTPTVIASPAVFADGVELFGGYAYVFSSTSLTVLDLEDGATLGRVTLPGSGRVTGSAVSGDVLYAFVSGSDRLVAIDLGSATEPVVVGELGVTVASTDVGLFAADDLVWLAGSGLRTVDVSDPTRPVLVSGADTNFTARRVALNGSGLALVTPDGGSNVSLYDTSDPSDTDAFVTRFDLSADARDAAISRGIGFVLTRDGLDVVNYRPFDALGQAPTVSVFVDAADVDPDTPGVQVLEGATLPVRVSTADDVQVFDVDLLVDGAEAARDVGYPFEFTVATPTLDGGPPIPLRFRARATDTGGNATLSDVVEVEVVPDTFPPVIVSSTPAQGGSIRQGAERLLRVRFDEAVASSAAAAGVFTVVAPGPDGTYGTADDRTLDSDVTLRDRDRLAQIAIRDVAPGDYQLRIDATRVTDRAGNRLGDGVVRTGFEALEVRPLIQGSDPTVLFVVDVSGSTGDPFGGTPLGDVNGDGVSDTILDAQLGSLALFNQELVNLGYAGSASIGLIPFASTARAVDVAPGVPGTQLVVGPAADTDGDLRRDVTQSLLTLRAGGGTNFERALREAINVFDTLGTAPGQGNIIFLSDGAAGGGNFTDEVQALETRGIERIVYGVGMGANLNDLSQIDANARRVTSTDEFLTAILGLG